MNAWAVLALLEVCTIGSVWALLRAGRNPFRPHPCVCGHARELHEHYSASSHCAGRAGACPCPSYLPQPWGVWS